VAETEKFRLEEKQRDVRRYREENNIPYQPKWFSQIGEDWIFKGDFWICKETNNIQDIPDLF
jgi:hypothetical protein